MTRKKKSNLKKAEAKEDVYLIPWKPLFLTPSDIAEIQVAYLDDNMTTREIAEACGVSRTLVGKAIKALRYDLSMIPRSETERMEKVMTRYGIQIGTTPRTERQPHTKVKRRNSAA